MTADTQRANLALAAEALAPLLHEHQVVHTHGNGPQVGLLALQNEAYEEVDPYPLDVLDAETEGMIGYLLEAELAARGCAGRIAAVLTQVVVDSEDPGFRDPHKFVGPVYTESQARRLATTRGWMVAPDGAQWRRVVPSPEPNRIVEIDAIRTLLRNGYTVICTGGGGIPVFEHEGRLVGAEAVVDKDLASARLAIDLGADALVLLTDVDAVYERWGTQDARPVRRATPADLRALQCAPGSMGPKVEAACRFAEHGGGRAAIGALADVAELVDGCAGTQVAAERHVLTARRGEGGAFWSIPARFPSPH
jgi:carbamate kinase